MRYANETSHGFSGIELWLFRFQMVRCKVIRGMQRLRGALAKPGEVLRQDLQHRKLQQENRSTAKAEARYNRQALYLSICDVTTAC